MALRTAQIPRALREVLAAEPGCGARIHALCGELLACRGYEVPLAGALLAAAAGRSGERWEERRLAVLMFQVQVLRALRSRTESRAIHSTLAASLISTGVPVASAPLRGESGM